MKRAFRAAVVALAVAALPGCYVMNIDATDLQPHIQLSGEPAAGTASSAVSEFSAETRASWLFWGLVQLDEPAVSDALAREIRRADGTAATDVRVVTQRKFVDSFLSVITLGIYGQRTTRIEGTVVR